jgi:hypothetical protein
VAAKHLPALTTRNGHEVYSTFSREKNIMAKSRRFLMSTIK